MATFVSVTPTPFWVGLSWWFLFLLTTKEVLGDEQQHPMLKAKEAAPEFAVTFPAANIYPNIFLWVLKQTSKDHNIQRSA